MTSPYSSKLLQQSNIDETNDGESNVATAARPTRPPLPQVNPQANRSVTHVVAAPQPQHMVPMAQPMMLPMQHQVVPAVPATPSRAGSITSVIMLGLVVLLLGVVALVGGYFATRSSLPTNDQVRGETSLAMREGYMAGRSRGVAMGMESGRNQIAVREQLNARLKTQKAWTSSYNQGRKAGERSYRAPRYNYGGGYRYPSYNWGGIGETTAAIGYAQNLANLTGAPVDVEIY